MKFYPTNISEFEKDGYFENNTLNCYQEYPPFYKVTSETSGTVEIYEVNEQILNAKEIDQKLLKTETLSFNDGKAYYLESTADYVGIFRYKLILSDSPFWSEMFRIIDAPSRTSYNSMDSGFLKFYDEDFLEFEKDGYFENNTPVIFNRYINKFYFDSELDVDTVTASIYVVDEAKLIAKIVDEYELTSLTLTENNNTIYLDSETSLEKGLYRIKATVVPDSGPNVDFYSELFCIQELGVWILADGYWNDLGIWLDDEVWNDN